MLKHADHKIKTLFLEEFAKELILNSGAKLEMPKPEIKEMIGPVPGMIKPLEKKESKEIEELAARIQAAQKEFVPSMLPGGAKGGGAGVGGGRAGGESGEIGGGGRAGGEGVGGGIGLRIKRGKGPLAIQKQRVKPIDTGSLYTLSARPTGAGRLSLGEGEMDLGKLNPLLKDREITTIECSGPGKFIVAKKAGQVNLTRITLSQQEINEIIEAFSEKTRIPIIGGLFRASIGELVITAVISEFVGSKFIIYKESPYSLLDIQTQQLQQAQFQQKR